jgi:iron complex outermembrane receptor protein
LCCPEIVVTGSRLARSGFDSAAPMDVVNVREGVELGYADVSELLISTPALAGSDQMTDVLSGILGANGGEGVQTADLRGLGAGRTLSLLNGRRAGPAGIRDGVGSFDINVIPVAGLERIEILKDGASSIYGSDAIGGVINYITRKGDGGEINAYTQRAEESGGEITQINASYGRETDRGYWRVTADYNKQEILLRGDREIFDCREEFLFWEADLKTRADMVDPRTDAYKCMGGNAGTFWVYDYNYYAYSNYYYDWDLYEYTGYVSNTTPPGDGVSFGGRLVYDWDGSIAATGLLDPWNGASNPGHLRMPEGFFIMPQGVAGQRFRGTSGEWDSLETMVPERERTTVMATGEFNLSDEVTLYAEALFNRRESEHDYLTQMWGYQYTSNWSFKPYPGEQCDYIYDSALWGDCVDYDYYTYRYVDVGGGDPLSEGWTGVFWFAPGGYAQGTGTRAKVDYTRMVLGAMGDIGQSGWGFDVSFQYSNSDGQYTDILPMQDAWRRSSNRVPLWGGYAIAACDGTTFDRYGPDGEIRQADIPCMAFNWVDPRIMAGDWTDEERAFMIAEEQGSTDYTNMAFDVGFTNNELFSMPAGEVGLAVGAQFMTDEIDDTPGIETLSCNVFNDFSGGWCGYPTSGETGTTAVYAETSIPLLAGKSGFDFLELNASARWTEVSIDATPSPEPGEPDNPARDFSDTTYKVGLNWKINDNFRFRANTGTSFRTPGLFELYRQNHIGSAGQRIDPCQGWGNKLEDGDITETMAANCAAEGIPDDIFSTLSMRVITGGGAAVLNPETATSDTVGMVFTASEANFRMSVDYWELEVKDQIGQFTPEGILRGCYDSDTYPNDLFCGLFERFPAGATVEAWKVDEVKSTYVNLDVQRTAGWDIEVDWVTSLANSWDLTTNVSATYTTEKETENAEGITTSRRGWAGNPEWVGYLTFRLDKGPWSAAWRMNYVDSTDNYREGISRTGSRIGLDGERETYYYSLTLDSRIYHNASLSYEFGEGWQANLSVTNLTDETPPRASGRAGIRIQGYGAFHSQYDWKGRRWGLNIRKEF